ncbi:hypothetical protein niasHS_017867 [Heterodera schachtii]|uniref:Ubiquinone biosynthesis protein COQ4 homolog, mitochondrial n=2 Tax=Heterodera TaxID=34509 RepID=A0ABD2I9R6_HETSC
MRSLQKSPYYCGQFGLVQRFGRQKEHRRDFSIERRGDQKGNGGVGDGSASGGGGGQRQMQQIGKGFSQQMFDHVGAIDDSPSASSSLLIGISELQRALLGIGSAVMSLVDPKRGDMVATMGETTVPHSLLKHLRDRLSRDVSGAELLRNRPRISGETIDRRWLATLPDATMGREYLRASFIRLLYHTSVFRFLDSLNTSPDARPPVQFVADDPELVYVMQRYRETHDFTHVLLQMRPNMLGEVTVKYFEAVQLGFPMCVAAAIFGALRLGPVHRRQLIERNIPWVVQQAERGRFLLALDWERRFEQKIADLQRECSIEPFSAECSNE